MRELPSAPRRLILLFKSFHVWPVRNAEEHVTTTLDTEHNTHDVSEVDLLKGEGLECRAELADSRLNGFLQVLLHVHSKERPGLLQHLDTDGRTHKDPQPKH